MEFTHDFLGSPVADRTWLDPAERAQSDVGFSGISDAWFSKLLLDLGDRCRNPFARWGFRVAALAGASYATVGEYMMNGADGGKLDLTSHTAGIAVGVGTYLLEKRKARKHYKGSFQNTDKIVR